VAYTIGLIQADSSGILKFFLLERSFQTWQLCPRHCAYIAEVRRKFLYIRRVYRWILLEI